MKFSEEVTYGALDQLMHIKGVVKVLATDQI